MKPEVEPARVRKSILGAVIIALAMTSIISTIVERCSERDESPYLKDVR